MVCKVAVCKKPLCGQRWLDRHAHDHTYQEIAELGIVVVFDGNRTYKADGTTRKGNIKKLTKLMRG